jgi:competence ComEA-like helix-hairpin-helix protein
MRDWWRTAVKDYLTFSKRERNGLLILFIVGVFLYFLPQFIQPAKVPVDNEAFLKEIARLKISVDTSTAFASSDKGYDVDESADYLRPKHYYDNRASVKAELFVFDPNTIDAVGWKRLGLRDKTVATIQKFKAKGFKFRKAEDIRRIYGLFPDEAERLMPYIRIAASENNPGNYTPNSYSSNNPRLSRVNYPPGTAAAYNPGIIEVNHADTAAFIALPGIGSKLASRIVNFRDKLGGFYSIDQVAETYGVPDSTFQKIKSRLECNNAGLRKININAADLNELKSHPYIRYALANAIVSYRNQHGKFKALEELRQIHLITEEIFKKIAPYLAV